jgi:hypothetical protein
VRKLEHLVLVVDVVDVEDAPAALDDPEVLAIASVPSAVEVVALVGSRHDLLVVATVDLLGLLALRPLAGI